MPAAGLTFHSFAPSIALALRAAVLCKITPVILCLAKEK